MGYEFKDEILVDIGPEPNCNSESEVENYYSKIRELEKVYAQAAKADEYEAKAKAFDVLYAEFYSDDISLMKADFDEALEYESGEQAAWDIIEKGDGENA